MLITSISINVGSNLTIQRKVNEEDAALNYGSGKLDKLFATPSLIALMIEASVMLIDDRLPEGFITASKSVEVVHTNPTRLGETISVNVKVKEFHNNIVTIEMVAFDEVGVIGKGSHQRVVVNKEALLENADRRANTLKSLNY